MKPLYKFYGDLLFQAYKERNLERCYLIQKEAIQIMKPKQYHIYQLYFEEMCRNEQKTSLQNAI